MPTQEPALNTMLSRQNPFGLIVALDETMSAKGQMYYDDGITHGKGMIAIFISFMLYLVIFIYRSTREWSIFLIYHRLQ